MSASRYMRLYWHVVIDVYGMRSAMTSIAQTRCLVHLPAWYRRTMRCAAKDFEQAALRGGEKIEADRTRSAGRHNR